jgi:hypothetical protein
MTSLRLRGSGADEWRGKAAHSDRIHAHSLSLAAYIALDFFPYLAHASCPLPSAKPGNVDKKASVHLQHLRRPSGLSYNRHTTTVVDVIIKPVLDKTEHTTPPQMQP